MTESGLMRTRHVALTAVTVCAPKVIYLNKRHSLILTNQQVMRNFHKFYSMYIYIYVVIPKYFRFIDFVKGLYSIDLKFVSFSVMWFTSHVLVPSFYWKWYELQLFTLKYQLLDIYIYSTKLTFLLRNTTRSVIILNQYCEGENISLCRNV